MPASPLHALFTSANPLPLVAPSILAADFAHMAADCRSVLEAGADLLHLDVMDGHFVPNLTMGPDMCRWLRKALPDAFLDVHLMVSDPAAYIEPFARAGANNLTFHVEVVTQKDEGLDGGVKVKGVKVKGVKDGGVADLASRIRELGMSAGLAINPPTDVTTLLPHIPEVDLVLVMSVNPGFGGQPFIPGVMDKVRSIKALQTPHQQLQMDGGINPATADACREAGCNVLVAGSSLFGQPAPTIPGIIRRLRSGATTPSFGP